MYVYVVSIYLLAQISASYGYYRSTTYRQGMTVNQVLGSNFPITEHVTDVGSMSMCAVACRSVQTCVSWLYEQLTEACRMSDGIINDQRALAPTPAPIWMLSMHTSSEGYSGTDDFIYVTISWASRDPGGADINSTEFLFDIPGDELEQEHVDTMIFVKPFDIPKILYIRQVTNTPANGDWKLEKAELVDARTGNVFVFPNDEWTNAGDSLMLTPTV